MQRRYALGAVAILALAVGVLLFAVKAHTPVPEASTNPTATTTVTVSSTTMTPSTSLPAQPIQKASTASTTQTPAPATATLVVDGARFALTAPAGSTLKAAMDQLQSEGHFSYAYREYAGLGAMVTEIQGRASTNSQYWILYVNGKQSDAGISSTHLRSGDVIEWKLEKSY